MSKTRNITLDILKIVMAIFVVGIHTIGLHFKIFEDVYVYTIFESLNIAVPVFFLASGFYFHKTILKGKNVVWFRKILIMYIVWTLIYSLQWKYSLFLSEKNPIVELIKIFLWGYHHLWYLSALIGGAIITLTLKNRSVKFLAGLIIFIFSIGAFIQYAGNYHFFSKVSPKLDLFLNDINTYRNFLFLGFPFFSTGYLISREKLNNCISSKQILVLILSGIIFLIIENNLNFTYCREGFSILISYIIICPAIFILALKKDIQTGIHFLSPISSGMYFIHPLVIGLTFSKIPNNYFLHFLSIVMISGGLGYVISKLKIIKNIV